MGKFNFPRSSTLAFPLVSSVSAFWPVCAIPLVAPTGMWPRDRRSMLLAAWSMKLGAYGLPAGGMTLFPEGLAGGAFHRCSLVIGSLWGLVALVQRDFKIFVVGFSSVSHMGFVLLVGHCHYHRLSGAVLQIFRTASSRTAVRVSAAWFRSRTHPCL